MPSESPVGAALGFEPRTEEVTAREELEVDGAFPPWLTGSLLRNGPGDWNAGRDRLAHWFDGFALLHHFDFADGAVHYSSRFLQSEARAEAKRTGELRSREFATDPCRTIFQRFHSLFDPSAVSTDNAAVSVQMLGDRLIALTETPLAVSFDRDTLERVGTAYRAPGQITTAHPHHDRDSGALINYAARLGPRSSYRIFAVAASDAAITEIAQIPVTRPSYMHSFGMTEHYVVLSEFPFVVDPLRLALSGRPFISNYRWEPERGTRFTVVDRLSGAVAARIQGEACFAFHHINAYEVGQSLIVDLCAAPDPSIIDELYLDRLRARLADPLESFADYPQPVRFTVDLPRRTAERRVLSDLGLDLPSVDHRQVRERPYRTVWGVGTGGNWMDRIHAVDVSTGESRTWQEPHTYPGEPVFVSRPGSSTEADGILLTVALDSDRGTSALVALDPSTLDCLARAEVGRPIPYGFHGLYTADGGSQPARRPGG